MTRILKNNPVIVLETAFLSGGFTTRSDFARENAEMVAQLAQRGFLTTDTPRDGYGNVWRLTPDGVEIVFSISDVMLADDPCPHCMADIYDDLGLPQLVSEHGFYPTVN
jgi:hypothetical protein